MGTLSQFPPSTTSTLVAPVIELPKRAEIARTLGSPRGLALPIYSRSVAAAVLAVISTLELIS